MSRRGGITATVISITADGKSTTVEYPVNYDAHSHPVTGSSEFDAIEMKRVSPFRSESSLLHAGRVIAKAVREVSGDEKTLTIVFEGTQSNGDPVRNVSVYRKQGAR